MRVFENIVLRKIFVPKANGVTTDGENFITKSFMIDTPRQMLQCNQMGQACSTYWDEEKKKCFNREIRRKETTSKTYY